MTTISLDSRVAVTTEQVSCTLSDEVIVLSLANGEYFGLNGVGARVWELLQEGRTLLELRGVLLEEYSDVDSERCTSDLLALLATLAEVDLIQIG